MSQHLGRRVIAVLLVIGAAVAVVLTRPVRLGLDLRGGTQVVLEAQDTTARRADSDATDRALEVMRRRVDQLGVTEPTLQRSGQRRIIVELPGVADPDEALRIIGRTAQLTFHPVLGIAEQPESESSPSRPRARPRPRHPLRRSLPRRSSSSRTRPDRRFALGPPA